VSVNFSHALFCLLSTHDDLVMAGLGLAPHGLVQHFILEFKTISYLQTKFKERTSFTFQ